MLDQLTPEQFREWQEYERLEPFGEERADLRNGLLIQAIGWMLAPLFGQHLADLKPHQFMPFSESPAEVLFEEDPELIFAKLELIAARFNGSQ